MAFPQKLQEYRKTEKLSQEELAYQLGVSRQSVSKWEQGSSFPETEKLIELSSLMGISIDSLLKEDSVAAETKPTNATTKRRWLLTLLIALLIVASAALFVMGFKISSLSSSQEQAVAETADEERLQETTTSPDSLGIPEPGFENKHLHDLQRWFYDFAQEYRLDYMPHFTQSEGAPEDSGEYLYWAYAINADHWGDNVGTMTKDYVEETVQQYFRIMPGQHRSHWKSWDFNTETEIYKAWPESLREKPHCLLNNIDIHGDCYTIHATCYSTDYLPTEEDAIRLKNKLLDGENTEMTPTSEITVSFYLDYASFHRPVFLSFEENFQIEIDTGAE